MAKVTCRCCGEKIDKKIAVAVKSGKQNKYYCPEHVGQKSSKEKMYDLIYEIFGRKVLHTILYKEMEEILSVHPVETVLAYLEENKNEISGFMCRSFVHEFAEVRYFCSIVKNSLADFKPKKNEPVIDKEIEVDEYIPRKVNKPKKRRTGMDALLDELLD